MNKENLAQTVASGSTGMAFSSGIFAYMNENAGAISLIIGFTSLLITAIFTYLSWKSGVKANKLTAERDRRKEENDELIRLADIEKAHLETKRNRLQIKKLEAELKNINNQLHQ